MFNYRKGYGFTLIETILFIAIVGISIAALARQYYTNVSRSHEPLLRQRAVSIANAYMAEIVHKHWNEATPLGGGCVDTGSGQCSDDEFPDLLPINAEETQRVDYDDIDDYHGISDEAPTSADGGAISNSDGFTASVTVTQPTVDWNGVDAADVRVITVTVKSPDGQNITLQSYRLNF